MTNEEAIKWVDDRMCWGRGTFTENHPPNIDECWEAGVMAIKALKKQAASEWIPVEQDLPDSDRPVLVTIQWTDSDREVTVGEYWGNPTKAAPESEKGWGTYGDHVTAWREMPEPYRERRER